MNEPIYTVDLFYDRSIEGIADFGGKPHHFRCEFDREADEYADVFLLTPIQASALVLVIERREISLRWKAAFEAGRVSLDTHPTLPEDRTRYAELQKAIDQAINDGQSHRFRARARFLDGDTVAWAKIP